MNLIKELQRKAQDHTISMTDLMTFALLVAEKSNHQDFRIWIKKEIYGYRFSQDVPDYRKVSLRFEELTPNGWKPSNVELLLNKTNLLALANYPLIESIYGIEESYNEAIKKGYDRMQYLLGPKINTLIAMHNEYLGMFNYPIELHVYMVQFKNGYCA